MAILDTDDVKAMLGIADSASDSKIAALLPAMEDLVTRSSGIYELAAVTERHSGSAASVLRLESGLNPIVIDDDHPFEIRRSDARDFSDDATIVAASTYYVDQDAGIVTTDGTFAEGNANYRVTFSRGYLAAEYPAALSGLIARAVGVGLETFTPEDFESIKIGTFSLTRRESSSGSADQGITSQIPEWSDVIGLFAADPEIG